MMIASKYQFILATDLVSVNKSLQTILVIEFSDQNKLITKYSPNSNRILIYFHNQFGFNH